MKDIKLILNWKTNTNPLTKVKGQESVCSTITASAMSRPTTEVVLYSRKLKDITNIKKAVKDNVRT